MAVVVPDIPELFEEAFERAGLELRTGYDIRTARRSMNLMMLEWANRGLNLFTVEPGTVSLTAGVPTYTMPAGTVDLIEHQLRTGSGTQQTDTALERVSVSTYAHQTNKNMTGRPVQIYIQRLADRVDVTMWPVPDSSTPYTLTYYRLKGIEGTTSGIGGDVVTMPPRFVPALVAGLAYHIAMKKPEAIARVMPLKAMYDEQFELAASEDRDRASVRFVPSNTAIFGGI